MEKERCSEQYEKHERYLAGELKNNWIKEEIIVNAPRSTGVSSNRLVTPALQAGDPGSSPGIPTMAQMQSKREAATER